MSSFMKYERSVARPCKNGEATHCKNATLAERNLAWAPRISHRCIHLTTTSFRVRKSKPRGPGLVVYSLLSTQRSSHMRDTAKTR